MGGQRYIAFISYSHVDRRAAESLLRKLQSYRLPKGATPQDMRRLGRFFLDRETLPASGDLTDAIKTGLQQSANLIVVCSPAAVKSIWINKEIETFRAFNPHGQVIAVVIEGEPGAREGPDLCFPAALLALKDDPLAADFRKKGDGPNLGFLKVAASLSGARLSALLQRDSNRQRRRLITGVTLSSVIALAMTALAGLAVQARQDAETRRAEAEDLVDFMLGDLRDRLEPVGRIDVLDDVAKKALSYYEIQGVSRLDCEATKRFAHALHLQAEVAANSADTARFTTSSQLALTTTERNLERCNQSAEAIFDHGRSAFWSGYAAHLVDQRDLAERNWTLYRDMASKLVLVDQSNQAYKKEFADASVNIGVFHSSGGNHASALPEFEAAIEQYASLAAADPDDEDISRNHADTLGWLARTHAFLGDPVVAKEFRLQEIESSRAIIAARAIAKPNDPDWELQFTLYSSLRNLSRLEFQNQEFEAAEQHALESVEGFAQLSEHDEMNAGWLNGLVRAQAMLLASQRASASTDKTAQTERTLHQYLQRLPENDRHTPQYWIDSLQLTSPL